MIFAALKERHMKELGEWLKNPVTFTAPGISVTAPGWFYCAFMLETLIAIGFFHR